MFYPNDIERLLRVASGDDVDANNFQEALRFCLAEAERRGWDEDIQGPLRGIIRGEGERLAREMAEYKAAGGKPAEAPKAEPTKPVASVPMAPGDFEASIVDPPKPADAAKSFDPAPTLTNEEEPTAEVPAPPPAPLKKKGSK